MFELIDYEELNARQQENYNFQKIAARLADFGYNCIRLSDDYQGADFIALHVDDKPLLKVQLKGRLSFHKKYYGKGLHVAFRHEEDVYVYPHDELRERLVAEGLLEKSKSENWVVDGSRSWKTIPAKLLTMLNEYRLRVPVDEA